ncbi:phage tail protein [Methylobacterium goesingense]|uniref:Microcystin-dependent protein n=1 Tax=Methylobacterium goesingense TaxID=243690 RepID=A0ABV2L430_9HYPH|nr:phage tail protein [Methylobacterium goesingense]GJD76201.1 hypothetical protein CFIICLFH_4451 [Methylobacterium goesingense]
MTGLIHFSTDAQSNDLGAPPINWSEGQPAKSVNNSARETMAAIARWRDDNAGGLIANRGGGDAYAVSTNQLFDAPSFEQAHTLAFTVSAANQGPATLAPDGLGALPIRRPGNLDLAPGDLQPAVIYRVARLGSFYLILGSNLAECGMVASFASPTVPSGWLICDGRALSRTTYAALFSRIGGYYGSDDAAGTFRLPDLRGRTVFGADAGVGRLTGAGGLGGALGSVGGVEAVTLTEAQLAAHSHTGEATGPAGGHDHGGKTQDAGQHSHGGATANGGVHSHVGTTGDGGAHTHTGSTDSAGTHTHGVQYLRQMNYATNGASGGTNALNAGDPSGTNTTGITDGNGAHTHSVTLTGAPAHQHPLTTADSAAHAHTIPTENAHAHGITRVDDHTHSLNLGSAGGGQAHTNIPPGLVVTFAIKA